MKNEKIIFTEKNMKKLILILISTLITFSLSAQIIGAKAGMSLSTVYELEDETDGLTITPGLILGGYTEIGEDNITLTGEMLLVQKGYFVNQTYNNYYGSNSYKTRASLTYLELNLMGNLYLTENISFGAGLYGGYWIYGIVNQKIKLSGNMTSETTETVDFSENDYQRIDIGVNLGGKLHLTENFNVGLRLSVGLLPAIDVDSEILNTSLQFGIGYSFEDL